MAPNKKKRNNKKKKAEKKRPATTAAAPSVVPPPARIQRNDETTARLERELAVFDEQADTLVMQYGGGHPIVLETRKRLGEKLRELTMYREELRWRQARREFDELYRLPPSEADDCGEECPICCEPIPIRPMRHVCCGKIECSGCVERFKTCELERLHQQLVEDEEGYEDLSEDEMTVKLMELMNGDKQSFRCHFCQQRLPSNDAEHRECVETAAQRGRAWAQNTLSEILFDEGMEEEGLVWLRKAAAQKYAPAQLSLGTKLIDQDPHEATRLMKIAAYKDDAIAQCVYGSQILEENPEEAILLLTLSACRGLHLAQAEMAKKFGGMDEPEEVELGLYWYEKAAEQGDANSQTQLAILMITRAERVYGSCFYPGYSPIPQAYRWNCRALKGGKTNGSGLAQVFENTFFSSCSCCGRSQQESNARFLQCSKCKACKYCSKTCQKRHHRDGHQLDCCDHDEPLSRKGK